ncbi:MAG: phosphoesterase [Ilumatobacteraceae bacterium]|nr:phosphoesterase [Ilumatobacteraceae bacterium]
MTIDAFPLPAPGAVDEHHEQIETYWRHNPISRRTALRGALLGVGAVALTNFPQLKRAFATSGGTTGKTGAIIVGRHLSFASDHRNRPENSMRVTAQVIFPNGVSAAGVKAFVRVGQSRGYGRKIDAHIVNLTGVVPNAPQGTLAGNQFYVKATIDNLWPGETCHYRFELSDGTTTGDGTFTTAPSRLGLGAHGIGRVPAPFTFTSFGDHGTNKAPTDPAFAYASNTSYTWAPASFDDNYYNPGDPVLAYDTTPAETMTALVAAQQPVFHLVNGDVCYADPSGTGLPVDDTSASGSHGGAPAGTNAYNPYVWDVYLAQIEASASSIPWMIATGNHDMEALYGNHGYGGHAARMDLPQNGPSGCPSVYRFVYANVGVISIDANDLSYEIPTNLGYSAGAQYTWVESTLAAWRADSKVDFIVMFMHHCAFSTSGAHASDLGVRGLVGTLADKYQVDLVLSGHNHQVERTNPIRNNVSALATPDGTTFDATLGTTYLTVGSAGRPRYLWQNAGGTADTTGTTDRYRGHNAGGGAITGYSGVKTFTGVGTSGTESVDWSQTRYLDYALARIDVVPARHGKQTTMSVTIVADGDRTSTGGGVPIDQIVLTRTAGAAGRPGHDHGDHDEDDDS